MSFILSRTLRKAVLFTIVMCFSASVSGAKKARENVVTRIIPDTTTVLRNPLCGWVMYLNRNWDDTFCQQEDYDHMPVNGGDGTASVFDYASVCYLRTSWSAFEPKEGQYAWKDDSSKLMRLLRYVMGRGCRIAFRVVVDGRDQGQNTPIFVKEAGAKGFYDNRGIWSPYVEDSVFKAKYSNFIHALAAEFDDPDKVEFIDGYGYGLWGEGHCLKYLDYKNKSREFKWNIDLYSDAFKKVPLVINYHRLIADTVSWAAAPSDSETLLDYAVKKGFSLRHDAFGMTDYYKDWEERYAEKWRLSRPIILEGGWITKAHHRYWKDSSGKYREGHSEDVRRGEYDAARKARVNMMDLRIGDEVRSWFGTAFDLVRRFVKEGGYRLYPETVCAPVEATNGEIVEITHKWVNLGFGYCPVNIPQWNQKYKVAFALFNENGEKALTFVDNATDLSTWLKNSPVEYVTKIAVNGVAKGKYTVAIGIVDVTKDNAIGLETAAPKEMKNGGWIMLNKINIKK